MSVVYHWQVVVKATVDIHALDREEAYALAQAWCDSIDDVDLDEFERVTNQGVERSRLIVEAVLKMYRLPAEPEPEPAGDRE